jgi:hypothetical protein
MSYSPFGPSRRPAFVGPSLSYRPAPKRRVKRKPLPTSLKAPATVEPTVEPTAEPTVEPARVIVAYDHPVARAARAGRASVLWHYVSRTPIPVPEDPIERRAFYIARWRYQLKLGRITPSEHAARLLAFSRGGTL